MSQIQLSKLVPHPLNEQIYEISNIDDLKASMSSHGQLVPIVINQNNEIISGHRRFIAAEDLGWKAIEAQQIKTKIDDIPKLIVHYNKQRIKTAQELLNEYDILIEKNKIGQGKRTDLTSGKSNRGSVTSRDKVATQIGISSSQLARLLYIRSKSPKFVPLITSGELSVNQAYERTQNGNKFRINDEENRKEYDFYETPYSITNHLLQNEQFDARYNVLEPAAGNGAIVSVLKSRFKKLHFYDRERDFFKDSEKYDYIITNPPYSQTVSFILHAKKLARKKIALLLPLNYLHGAEIYSTIFSDEQFRLARLYVFVRSILLGEKPRKDGRYKSGLQIYAWYIWDKSYNGDPTLHWIDNADDVRGLKD